VVRLPVGHEALESSNGHGLVLSTQNAGGLTLGLLGADPPTDAGQVVGVFEYSDGVFKPPLAQREDEAGDVNAHGAAGYTRGALALEAT
jgi:hypothetical protein